MIVSLIVGILIFICGMGVGGAYTSRCYTKAIRNLKAKDYISVNKRHTPRN